jgi:hypothetical protein
LFRCGSESKHRRFVHFNATSRGNHSRQPDRWQDTTPRYRSVPLHRRSRVERRHKSRGDHSRQPFEATIPGNHSRQPPFEATTIRGNHRVHSSTPETPPFEATTASTRVRPRRKQGDPPWITNNQPPKTRMRVQSSDRWRDAEEATNTSTPRHGSLPLHRRSRVERRHRSPYYMIRDQKTTKLTAPHL